jgi:hypothetical protein
VHPRVGRVGSSQATLVTPASGSGCTARTVRSAQRSLDVEAIRSRPTNSSVSPGRSSVTVPARCRWVSPATGGAGRLLLATSAFHSGRASSSTSVSKVCGSSPGPGRLATLVPAGTGTSAGAPAVSSRAKASQALAARPGARW